MVICLLKGLDPFGNPVIGFLVCLGHRLVNGSEVRFHGFVDLLGQFVQFFQESVLGLLAEFLSGLLDFLLLGLGTCHHGLRCGLTGLEILLEGYAGFHLLPEGPGCITESLDTLLLEDLDCCDDSLERCDDILQDGVADSHHTLDHLVQDAGCGDEFSHLADDISEDFRHLFEDVGEEVHDRLEGSHGFLHSLHCRLVVLQGICEFECDGNEETDGSDCRGFGDALQAVLHSVQTSAYGTEGFLEDIGLFGQVLRHVRECLLDGTGIVTHVALVVALEGIHCLELVVDILDLLPQLGSPHHIGGGPEFLLEGCHVMDKGIVGFPRPCRCLRHILHR